MKIKLKAPEGYKLHDALTDRDYSEIVVDEKEQGRFSLIPAQNETIIMD